jgi:hypothetical protein
MAVFEYQCPKGHITELFVKLEDKPAFVECGSGDGDNPCFDHAWPILSATPTTFRSNDRKCFKRKGH